MNLDWFSRGRDWLQAVISERFGDNVVLSRSDGVVRIRLAGSERSIALASDLATFSRRDSNLPCSVWDAASEGWHAPLGSPIPAPGSGRLPQPLIEEREDELLLKLLWGTDGALDRPAASTQVRALHAIDAPARGRHGRSAVRRTTGGLQ